eukprot:GDKJ01026015.1.p1 GENE.GDKJ01026015.1~~GDKJ01026015.1.p1  ORF type:complete len:950 (-),score=211.45 GDKJ01026015.1:88-2898(-)
MKSLFFRSNVGRNYIATLVINRSINTASDYMSIKKSIALTDLDEIKLVQHWTSFFKDRSRSDALINTFDLPLSLLKDPKTFDKYKSWLGSKSDVLNSVRSDFSSLSPSVDAFNSSIERFIRDELIHSIITMKNIRKIADLTCLPSKFPVARSLSPRVVYTHFGPPNSGKTHHAIAALAAAPTGIYSAPLRILAWEIFDRLNAMGIACELRTGQEHLKAKNGQKATHTSCTIEMTPTDRTFDVAVIDEIQMVADAGRGSNWFNALIGVAAPQVHVCGDGRVARLIEEVIKNDCKDLIVKFKDYQRLCPLIVETNPVLTAAGMKKGDCLISCDRSQLIKRRQQLARLGVPSAIIWGSMPPSVRRKQLDKFSGHAAHVLLATDAIGLGVNLRINRVILDSLSKFDGDRVRPLSFSEIRQLGGRAGRYGLGASSDSEETEEKDGAEENRNQSDTNVIEIKVSASKSSSDAGRVAVMNESDVPLLRLAMRGLESVREEKSEIFDAETESVTREKMSTSFLLNEKKRFEEILSSQMADFISSLNLTDERGLITSIDAAASAMQESETKKMRLQVAPLPQLIDAFAHQLEQEVGKTGVPLKLVLQNFVEFARVKDIDTVAIGDLKAALAIADALDGVSLPRKTLIQMLFAPVDIADANGLIDLRTFAEYWSHTDKCLLPPWLDYVKLVKEIGAEEMDPPRTYDRLKEMEMTWASLDVYLWLGEKFGKAVFCETGKARSSQQIIENLMSVALEGVLSLDLSVEQETDREKMASLEMEGLTSTLRALVDEGYIERINANEIIGQAAVLAAHEYGQVSKGTLLKDGLIHDKPTQNSDDSASSAAVNDEKMSRSIESDPWLADSMLEGTDGGEGESGGWAAGRRLLIVKPMVERLKDEGAWLAWKKNEGGKIGFFHRENKRSRNSKKEESFEQWKQKQESGNKGKIL